MKLELINVDRQKPPIVLHQFPVIVGLDPGEDVCLEDSAVGHYQCMIDFSDGGLMVWDLGTRSGTFINGARVSQNAPLQSGDSSPSARTASGPLRQRHGQTVEAAEHAHRRRQPAIPA